jgi:hypothetical protein
MRVPVREYTLAEKRRILATDYTYQLQEDPEFDTLYEMVFEGFTGFSSMSKAELEQAWQESFGEEPLAARDIAIDLGIT